MPEADRFEIDKALYEAVPYGAYSKLAKHRNIAVNNISKYYDPHDPDYQSDFSRALLELQVIARVSPDWAQNILKVINLFGVRWSGGPKLAGMTDVVSLTARVFDPETPYQDRLPLALKLQDEVNKMVDGLRYEDLDDTASESPLNKPLVSAR